MAGGREERKDMKEDRESIHLTEEDLEKVNGGTPGGGALEIIQPEVKDNMFPLGDDKKDFKLQ